ncbi:MAG: hypothetical protein ACI957_003810, partial [Verrucomicrobiales bacterium]
NDFEILNEDRRYSFESTVLLNHYFNKVEVVRIPGEVVEAAMSTFSEAAAISGPGAALESWALSLLTSNDIETTTPCRFKMLRSRVRAKHGEERFLSYRSPHSPALPLAVSVGNKGCISKDHRPKPGPPGILGVSWRSLMMAETIVWDLHGAAVCKYPAQSATGRSVRPLERKSFRPPEGSGSIQEPPTTRPRPS